MMYAPSHQEISILVYGIAAIVSVATVFVRHCRKPALASQPEQDYSQMSEAELHEAVDQALQVSDEASEFEAQAAQEIEEMTDAQLFEKVDRILESEPDSLPALASQQPVDEFEKMTLRQMRKYCQKNLMEDRALKNGGTKSFCLIAGYTKMKLEVLKEKVREIVADKQLA